MNGEPGVDQPFGIDRPKVTKSELTIYHHTTVGQGLQYIGIGIAIVGIAVFLSVVVIVTYLNAQVN